MKKIDAVVTQKFAVAVGTLMTREFSTGLPSNSRRLMVACGPVLRGSRLAQPAPDGKFDVLGLKFTPGKEWKGPSQVFVEEMREGQLNIWANCALYASTNTGPIYVLTDDPDVCFSFDGDALVPLTGTLDDRREGVLRAKSLLRTAARRLPDDIEQHRMM